MEEYLQHGHMELLKAEDLNSHPNYYLPHHAIINQNSKTKIEGCLPRFGDSSNGQSLNSVLMKGIKLQTSIFSNLIVQTTKSSFTSRYRNSVPKNTIL